MIPEAQLRWLILSTLVASAVAFVPLERKPSDTTWTPAKETGQLPPDIILNSANKVGWSPKPTDAPHRFDAMGRMDIFRRQEEYTMGTDTCGFVEDYKSIPVTCLGRSAYCTNDGEGNMDCCSGAYSECKTNMYSACLDYSASMRGACSNAGPRTICCWQSSPSCFTFLSSTSASPGKVFSLLQCASQNGLATILATPPGLLTTSTSPTSSPSTQSSSTSTRFSASPSSDFTPTNTPSTVNSTDGGGGTPIGAIVGGAVGGAAVVGLLVFLFCFYIIRPQRSDAKRLVNKNQGAGGGGIGGQQQQKTGMAQTLDPNNPQNQQFLPIVPGVAGAGDVKPLEQQQQQAAYAHGGGYNNANTLYPQHHQQGGMYPSSQPANTGITPPQNNHFQQSGMYPQPGQPQQYPQQPGYPFLHSQQQQHQQQHPRPPGPPAGTTELPVHYPRGTEGHRAELKGS